MGNGKTLLHKASFNGHVDVVNALLAHGVDASINEKDNDGVTPLHGASFHGHVDVVNALLAHGGEASLNEKNNFGFTPLHMACVKAMSTSSTPSSPTERMHPSTKRTTMGRLLSTRRPILAVSMCSTPSSP